jgi:hypothetical protein
VEDLDAVIAHARARLSMREDEVPDGYGHLGLCIIDSVYSIGIRYAGVRNVIGRYCEHAGIRELGTRNQPAQDEHTVVRLLEQYEQYGWEHLMEQVYDNRTWTSPTGRSRLRKAEAVGRFARVLHEHGIDSVADAKRAASAQVKGDVVKLPGQGSGLTHFYVLMLAGVDDYVKADRHVIRFVSDALGRRTSQRETEALVCEAAWTLAQRRPWITPTVLDNAIWRYQTQR